MHKPLFQLLSLFVLYRLLHSSLYHLTHKLDQSLYHNSDSFFISAFSSNIFFIFFITLLSYLSFNYKNIAWHTFSNNKALRVFILILAFPLFWEHSFSDYNYYLDTDTNIDKILIAITFLLIYFHPLFLFIFVSMGFVIWTFISFPFAAETHWHDVRPAYEILVLFVAFLLLKSSKFFKTMPLYLFVLLALTMHASNYFVAGTGKIEISPNGWEWALLDNTSNLFVSSYVNGWLGFLNESSILSLARYLDKVDFLLTIPTLLIQLFAIFLLINKRITLWFFLFFEVLHLGIVLAGGIVFWTWIVVNIGFFYLIKNMNDELSSKLYSKKVLATFMFITLLSPILYKPTVLAWWDAPMHASYDLYITTDKNQTRKLNTLDLSPYNTMFAQESFSYTHKEPVLVPYNYGFIIRDLHVYSNFTLLLSNVNCNNCLKERIDSYKNDSYKLYRSLENAKSVTELRELIKAKGKILYDEEKREVLKEFLRTYFKNVNKKPKQEPFYKNFGAPYHQYDLSSKRLDSNEKVQKIELVKYNVWYNKQEKKLVHFDKKTVMTLHID